MGDLVTPAERHALALAPLPEVRQATASHGWAGVTWTSKKPTPQPDDYQTIVRACYTQAARREDARV